MVAEVLPVHPAQEAVMVTLPPYSACGCSSAFQVTFSAVFSTICALTLYLAAPASETARVTPVAAPVTAPYTAAWAVAPRCSTVWSVKTPLKETPAAGAGGAAADSWG